MDAVHQVAQVSYDWWDLVPAIVGGIIGALAGGIPAWLLARRESNENLRRDKEQRVEQELAAAFRIFTKLSIMVNDLASTLIQIEEMLLRPVDPNDEAPTQRRISAFAGAASEPELPFAPEELQILLAADEADYLMQLDLFARRYAGNLRALHTYGELKSKLHDLMAESEQVKFGPGNTILTKIDDKNAPKLRIQARTLESLIVPLIDAIRNDTVLGVRLALQYGPKMKAYFGNRRVPFFDFSDLKKVLPSLPIEEIDPPTSKVESAETTSNA